VRSEPATAPGFPLLPPPLRRVNFPIPPENSFTLRFRNVLSSSGLRITGYGLIQIHRGRYRYRRLPEDGQLRVRLRQLAGDGAGSATAGCRGATGARRIGGEPQAGVAVVCGAEAGLRRKRGRRRAPPQREWCWRRRPSRTRYGWTSRTKRSPADGQYLRSS
jgi:hypothetical protein